MAKFYNPESELLVCCSRTNITPKTTDRIKTLLMKEIDWEYLLRTAINHGVMPLLYKNLNANLQDSVPESFFKKLKDYFYTNIKRNILLTEEMFEILNKFEALGISAIPFKGPIIAESVYGSIAYRQFVDIDILVHRKDVSKAKELILSRGYQPIYKLSKAGEKAHMQSRFDFFFNRDSTYIEIHWQIIPKHFSIPIDMEKFWERLTSISISGRNVPTISPIDMFFILCLHGYRHLWQRLFWICDVAQFIQFHKDLNWERIMKQASELGIERIVYLALFLANDLLDMVLPDTISKMVQKDPVVKSLAMQVNQWLFNNTNKGPRGLQYCLFHLKARERIRNRIQYCVLLLINPNVKDWNFLPMSQNLFPLYYFLRPVRLAKDYVLKPLKRL
jgi:hypothetical protein